MLEAALQMRWPLLQVLWVDSTDPANDWLPLGDLEGYPGSLDCTSVGWLVGEDKESVTLAAHLSYPEEECPRVCGVISIPKAAILGTKTISVSSSASLRASFSVPAFGSFSVPFSASGRASQRGQPGRSVRRRVSSR